MCECLLVFACVCAFVILLRVAKLIGSNLSSALGYATFYILFPSTSQRGSLALNGCLASGQSARYFGDVLARRHLPHCRRMLEHEVCHMQRRSGMLISADPSVPPDQRMAVRLARQNLPADSLITRSLIIP
jgi:hypothetical protein